MRRLRFLADIGSFLVVGGIGVVSVLAGVGVLSLGSLTPYLDRSPGTIFVIVVGALLLAIAARFVLRFLESLGEGVLFSHQGEWGAIELSPQAVREFISDILRRQVGIERFRIGLKHHDDGVAITVRTALTPEQRVTEMGARIQKELARHVTERTGVEVREVTVLVRSIRRDDAMSTVPETPAEREAEPETISLSSAAAPERPEAVIDADRAER